MLHRRTGASQRQGPGRVPPSAAQRQEGSRGDGSGGESRSLGQAGAERHSPWHCSRRFLRQLLRRGGRDCRDEWNATVKDRKSTRLNSSHTVISYAVFCLKKKKQQWTEN